MMTSLKITCCVCQWKNFDNRSKFGEVTAKSLLAWFFDSVYALIVAFFCSGIEYIEYYMNLFVVDSVTQSPVSEIFKTSDDEWECRVCSVQNTSASDKCVKCNTNRPRDSSQNTDDVAKVSWLCCCLYCTQFVVNYCLLAWQQLSCFSTNCLAMWH